MANHHPQIPGGGVFIPPGAVDPQKMLAVQVRNMRINIAGETMARLVAADVAAADVAARLPHNVTVLAQHAVACADALLRELSKGEFALPIEWKDQECSGG